MAKVSKTEFKKFLIDYYRKYNDDFLKALDFTKSNKNIVEINKMFCERFYIFDNDLYYSSRSEYENLRLMGKYLE